MGIPSIDGVPYHLQYPQAPAQPVVPPPQPQEEFHRVEAGDTLESIAQKYSTPEAPVTAQQIAERNQIGNGPIDPGKDLIVPTIKQHAAPKADPNPSPEQAKSDEAMKKYLTAEDNLAAFDSGYTRQHNDPDYQPIRSGYAGLSGTAREELQKSIAAEIKADFGAGANGGVFDAKAIQQYGAEIVKRYDQDPAGKAAAEAAVKEVGIQHEVDSTLQSAGAASDPKGAVETLSRELPKLSPEAQTRLLSSDGFDKLIEQKIGPAFTDSLKGEPWKDASSGPAAKPMESMQKLEKLIEGAEPRIAGALAEHGVDALKDFLGRAENDGYSIRLGIDGTRALVHIASQVGGTSEGDVAIRGMTDLPLDGSQIHLGVSEGASPHLSIAMAQAHGGPQSVDAAIMGVQMYAGSVNGNVDKLAKHTDELSWLINNHGGSMTPDQLNQAIKDYTSGAGAGWAKTAEELQNKVADQGKTLLDQIDSLSNAPADQQDKTRKAIEGILGDTKSSYAISLALKQHPDYIDSLAGKRLMQNLAYTGKFGEQGIKLGKEIANAYVRNDVLSAAHNYDPRNPASIQQAEQAIEKLKNPALVKLLGMDVESGKYQSYVKLVDELKKSLPAAGDGTEQIVAKLKTHAEAMNNADSRFTAESSRPVFEKNQPAGQLLRTVGLGFATMGFMNSVSKASDGQFSLTNKNDLKAIVDAAGLGQKGTELAVGLGMVTEDSTLGRFGAGNKLNGESIDPGRWTRADRVFGYLTAGFDYWNAVEQHQKGDDVRAGLYLTSGVGGTMAALSGTSIASALGAGSWLGPVGIGLVVVATAGLTIKDRVEHSNAHMNPASAKFLEHAQFNPQVSQALVDQSGEGWSPVTLLARYAEAKGYKLDEPGQRDRFVAWVNAMPTDKLERFRTELHHALDQFDGDVSKLGSDTTVVRPEAYIATRGGAAKVDGVVSTVGHLDAVVRDFGIPQLPQP